MSGNCQFFLTFSYFSIMYMEAVIRRPGEPTEAATGGALWKKVFLEISQNSQENTCARVSFLIKLLALLIKIETLGQVFSCENVKFPRTPFFTEHLWTTTSEPGRETLLKKRLLYRCFPMNFAKFLRTPIFTEHLWWLLLCLISCSSFMLVSHLVLELEF